MKTIRILGGLAAIPLPRPGAFAAGISMAFLAVALWLAAAFMSSCTTHVTRTITTDKAGTVTDTTTTAKGLDPAALKLAEVVAAVYVPRRPLVVREEKSDARMRHLLRGWQGEIEGERPTPNIER